MYLDSCKGKQKKHRGNRSKQGKEKKNGIKEKAQEKEQREENEREREDQKKKKNEGYPFTGSSKLTCMPMRKNNDIIIILLGMTSLLQENLFSDAHITQSQSI